ncbi:MAG: low temperature requirement protein A [Ilumatobacteraceae bacterium]
MSAAAPLSVVVVGSGNVGTALATNLRALGHQVRIARRSAGDDDSIGIDGASVDADVTILAVPFGVVADVVALGLRPVPSWSTPPTRSGNRCPRGAASGVSVVVQAAGHGVHVVKAFNVLGAEHMAAPTLPDGHRPLLPVAADDATARRLVADLATAMGFGAVEIGTVSPTPGLLEEVCSLLGPARLSGRSRSRHGAGRPSAAAGHRWAVFGGRRALMSTDHGATARRVGFLELFFDLVFVFAVTQLVSLLHGDHSAAGWGRASLMMWLVWWAWSQYTWSGNAIDLDRRSTRLWMLVASGAMLGAAAAIPTAFDDMGEWFALPYAGMRLLGLALYWLGQHDTTYRAALRLYLPIASVGPVLVLAGGLVDDGARVALWAAALAVDVVSVLAAGRREFHVDPGHFAERHGLIVIIALGESVIATGATASDVGLDRDVMILLATAFVAVAALWWSYFDWVHHAAEETARLRVGPSPTRPPGPRPVHVGAPPDRRRHGGVRRRDRRGWCTRPCRWNRSPSPRSR